jgi:hypothetical protein
MRRTVLALLATALAAGPAAAGYFPFTGTLTVADSSPKFLVKGASVSGSGIGFSSRAPSNEIRSFGGVVGFTGAAQTTYISPTAGFRFTQEQSITGIGDPRFSQFPSPKLHGKMPVRGQFWRRFLAYSTIHPTTETTASFPLTINGTAGLGLGNTLMGLMSSIRFGTWTTGTVIEPAVTTEKQTGSRTISAMGFDARTPAGMGTVQLVTPVRVLSGLLPSRTQAAVVSLTLHFVPEPGQAALLLSGSVALLVLGRRRRA